MQIYVLSHRFGMDMEEPYVSKEYMDCYELMERNYKATLADAADLDTTVGNKEIDEWGATIEADVNYEWTISSHEV